MPNLLGWMRFVVYDGDMGELYGTIADALGEAKKDAIFEGTKLGPVGDYVKPIDLHNEVLAW